MKAAVAAVQTRFKNVLFATDFSDAAARAIPYIREIAKHYDADLLTLHVRPPRVQSIRYYPTSPTNTADAKIEDEHRREEILAVFPGIRTKVLIEEGSIDDHLESALRMNNIDLIVLGTTGQTRNGRHRLGSVAEELFKTVTCPVLTVGPHSRQTLQAPISARYSVRRTKHSRMLWLMQFLFRTSSNPAGFF